MVLCDGKPGAPPPKNINRVCSILKKHVGRGVLLQSDGGSGGDGMSDECVEKSIRKSGSES